MRKYTLSLAMILGLLILGNTPYSVRAQEDDYSDYYASSVDFQTLPNLNAEPDIVMPISNDIVTSDLSPSIIFASPSKDYNLPAIDLTGIQNAPGIGPDSLTSSGIVMPEQDFKLTGPDYIGLNGISAYQISPNMEWGSVVNPATMADTKEIYPSSLNYSGASLPNADISFLSDGIDDMPINTSAQPISASQGFISDNNNIFTQAPNLNIPLDMPQSQGKLISTTEPSDILDSSAEYDFTPLLYGPAGQFAIAPTSAPAPAVTSVEQTATPSITVIPDTSIQTTIMPLADIAGRGNSEAITNKMLYNKVVTEIPEVTATTPTIMSEDGPVIPMESMKTAEAGQSTSGEVTVNKNGDGIFVTFVGLKRNGDPSLNQNPDNDEMMSWSEMNRKGILQLTDAGSSNLRIERFTKDATYTNKDGEVVTAPVVDLIREGKVKIIHNGTEWKYNKI